MDRRDLLAIALLLAWAGLMQSVVIARATVPAQDAVDFVAMAQKFARVGVSAGLAAEPDQPLFAIWLLGVRRTFTAIGWLEPHDWGLAAQCASALPVVVAVGLMYGLMRRWCSICEAGLACAVFAALPEVARLGADGISDGLHLALSAAALGATVVALESSREPGGTTSRASVWRLLSGIVAGVLLSLAATCRAESLIIWPALALVFSVGVIRRWRDPLAGTPSVEMVGLGLFIGAMAVVTPYLVLSDCASGPAVVARMLGRQRASETAPLNSAANWQPAAEAAMAPPEQLSDGTRAVYGRKDATVSHRFPSSNAALAACFERLGKLFAWWTAPLALLGWWQARYRLAGDTRLLFAAIVALLLASVVWVALSSGYAEARHMMLVLLVASVFWGVGLCCLADWAKQLLAATIGRKGLARFPTWALAGGLALVGMAVVLPRAVNPLHARRIGHREAAAWIVDRQPPAPANGRPPLPVVLDGCGWTALYTGLPTYRYELAEQAYADPRLAYVVMPVADIEAQSPRGATLRALLAAGGQPVAEFNQPGAPRAWAVAVYLWNQQHFAQHEERTDARQR